MQWRPGASAGERPSVRRRSSRLRGDDRENAKAADSMATAVGRNQAGGGVTGRSRRQVGGRSSLTDPTAAA